MGIGLTGMRWRTNDGAGGQADVVFQNRVLHCVVMLRTACDAGNSIFPRLRMAVDSEEELMHTRACARELLKAKIR